MCQRLLNAANGLVALAAPTFRFTGSTSRTESESVGTVTFYVERTGPTTASASVNVTSGGTATPAGGMGPADFALAATALFFEAGQVTASLSVTVLP